MPGTFIFRPFRAELIREKGLFEKFDPLIKFKIGKHKAKTRPCKEGGHLPHWDDVVLVKRDNEHFCELILKDHNKLNPKRRIGECLVPLSMVEKQGQFTGWFDIYRKDKYEGKVFMEIIYTPCDMHSHDVPLSLKKLRGESVPDVNQVNEVKPGEIVAGGQVGI